MWVMGLSRIWVRNSDFKYLQKERDVCVRAFFFLGNIRIMGSNLIWNKSDHFEYLQKEREMCERPF